MSIIPTTLVNAFLNEDETLVDRDKNQLKKNFQTYRSELLNYGILETGSDHRLNLMPSPVEGVRPTKRALLPMVIKIIPPPFFPSGNFTTETIPAPQNVDVRLIRVTTNLSGGSASNIATVNEATSIVPSQDTYIILNPTRILDIQYTFRTSGNTIAQGNLPITFVSSDPSVVVVSDVGEVSFLSLPSQGVTVTLSATRQDGQTLTSQILFTSDVTASVTFAPLATESQTASNEVTTLVSQGVAEDQSNFLNTLKDRYLSFRGDAREADEAFDAVTQQIVKGRSEVVDTYSQRSKLIRESREPGANERFLANQIQAIKDLPPLVMYINPAELSTSYNHLISDGNKGRDGYIVEHWGLDQPLLSASGSIGGTYVTGTNSRGKGMGGITRTLRRGSAAYQSFMTLYQTYRNNAYIFNLDQKISLLGTVQIYYGDTIYTGSFNSFSIQESEDKPFDLNYAFQFSVRFEEKII